MMVRVQKNIYVCISLFSHIFVDVHACKYMCVYIYEHIYTHTQSQRETHTYMETSYSSI